MAEQKQMREDTVKLLKMRRNLKNMCSSVEQQRLKTDIEWMNLVALAKNSNKAKPMSEDSAKKKSPVKVKDTSLDGPKGSLPPLDLNPKRPDRYHNSDEEFDSD